MNPAAASLSTVRFGAFEVGFRSGELRKNGLRIRLQGQPFQVLAMLLEHPGEIVTREEFRKKVWSEDTFVDFDHSLGTAINKIREALGDSAENPRFVETLHRRGYRFIYPVAAASSPPTYGDGDIAATGVGAGLAPPTRASVSRRTPLRRRWMIAAAGGAVVAVVAVLLALNVAGLRDRVLRAVGAVREPPLQIHSIAVLPLENLSRDPDQEYFADGMTEALISEVGQIGALRVISRQSVMRYKGSDKPLTQIAQELNVDALIEGAVLRSGDRVRVTVQLIGAVPERHLWARSYERDLRDVLTLQGEIARAVADEVKAKLTPDVEARLAGARPVNPEAHELYLKGNELLRRGDPKKALEYFQEATQNDPNFARAYLGIATAYDALGSNVELASVDAFAKESVEAERKAKTFARKALELDDSLAEAHVVLAYGLWFGDWDWSGCEREIKRALEINPNSVSALGIYNGYLSFVDRPEESIAQARRALEINPLVAEPYFRMGWAYYYARRYDEALAQFEKVKALEKNPGEHLPMSLGQAYAGKGMYKEAIAQFLQMPDTSLKLGLLGNAYARAGNKADARKIAHKLAERSAKEHVGNFDLSVLYAGLGEKDKALQSLEEAYRVHDVWLSRMKVDPPLDPLRSDPRFQDLLRRMNFPP